MSNGPGTSVFGDFAHKRSLWWQFTVRNVQMRHRGSYLGFLWNILNPLLMCSVYLFVFGIVFQGRFREIPNETSVDFALGLFLGLVYFNALADVLAISPTLIVTSANLVKKVVFPLEVLPLAQVGAVWFNLLISLTLLLVGAQAFGHGVPLTGLCWLPALLLPHLLLTMGLSWLLAALGVFLRDTSQMIPFTLQLVLYSSAIFYSRDFVPHSVWTFLRWNPLLENIRLARDALLWDKAVPLRPLAYICVFDFAVFLAGGFLFRKAKPAFADVL